MTWTYSITPEIPGLSIVPDGGNAMLRGHPLIVFSGVITITATNGAISISNSFQLNLFPLSKIAIAAIENTSDLSNKVAIESYEIKATVLPGRILIQSVPIVQATLTTKITFTSD